MKPKCTRETHFYWLTLQFRNEFFGTFLILVHHATLFWRSFFALALAQYSVKLGDMERFDKQQIGDKDQFSVTNLQVNS